MARAVTHTERCAYPLHARANAAARALRSRAARLYGDAPAAVRALRTAGGLVDKRTAGRLTDPEGGHGRLFHELMLIAAAGPSEATETLVELARALECLDVDRLEALLAEERTRRG